jgi:uncharacterized glyoxalase superfamily protein PhnB
MKLNTYLNFDGNCEEALKFYEKALGAYFDLLKIGAEAEELRRKLDRQGSALHWSCLSLVRFHYPFG